MKVMERLRSFQIEGDYRDLITKSNHNSDLDPCAVENVIGTTSKT